MGGNIKQAVCSLASGFLAAGMLTYAHAVQIKLHGDGYQDYVQVDGNTYLGAVGKGPWDNNFPGLVCDVDINAKSRIWVQTRSVNAAKSPSSSLTKAF